MLVSRTEQPQTGLNPATARKRGLSARRAMSATARHSASLRLVYRLLKVMKPETSNVAIYLATPDEVNVTALISILTAQKIRVVAPVIDSDYRLRWRKINPRSVFHRNRFNIKEPRVLDRYRCKTSRAAIDTIVAPLSAFDKHNQRTGMGGGYYDRVIASLGNRLNCDYIGVAFDRQRCRLINVAPWDEPLDIVVTESETYRRSHFRRSKPMRLKPLLRKAKLHTRDRV